MSTTNGQAKRKTSIMASMTLDLFGVEVMLKGRYTPEFTLLECVADLSKDGHLVRDVFRKALPADWQYAADRIDLEKMEVAVQFSEKDGLQYIKIGTAVEVDGKQLLFQLYKQGEELLVSMSLDAVIGFGGLPLVGEYLPENAGIEHLQIAYYSKGKKTGEGLLQKILEPKSLERYPSKTAVINEGVNIFAHIQVADFQLPLSYPLDAILDQAGPEKSSKMLPVPDQANKALPEKSEKKFLDIRKTELLYKNNRLAFQISGAVSVSIFELEVMGLQVSAPLDIFNDFSFKKLGFELQGLSLDIQKPPFSMTGAFLRVQRETGDDYLGLLNVGFKHFQFTAMGAYSKAEGQNSLFVFAFIGAPMGGPPFFFVTGLAFGFGMNRDFILPDIGKVASFPLVKMCAGGQAPQMDKNNPKEGVLQTLKSLGDAIPPNPGAYFVVAGIRFESFKIIKTMAIAVIKFGKEFEINLLGVSSLTLPTAYVELAFSVQFAPAQGVFMARGQLTDRSYLLFPGVKLTGGFAVGFWFAGDHSGDFVISMGGYHPRYNVPAHFPANIPRIGLFLKLGDNVTLSGEMYFALTPQAIMAGVAVSAVYSDGFLYASLAIRADFILLWKPFYYEAKVNIEAYVKFRIGIGWLSKEVDFHLHTGVEIWGPDFSGRAFLDAGIKTFQIGFGANAPRGAGTLDWDAFRSEFIPEKPCTVNVGGGLIRKISFIPAGETKETECWVINPKELVLITDSIVPATQARLNEDVLECRDIASPGVAPMGKQMFKATHRIELKKEGKPIRLKDKDNLKFTFTQVTKNLPKALWGDTKPDPGSPPDAQNSLLKNALAGFEIRPLDVIGGKTRAFSDSELAYQFDRQEKLCLTPAKTFIETTNSTQSMQENHQCYTSETDLRRKDAIEALKDFLPEGTIVPDLSDMSSDIPVYTYSEPFIETKLA